MEFVPETQNLIEKLYKNRKHVELTIGILREGEVQVVHWGPDKKVMDGDTLIYPVGSICKPFTTCLLAKYVSEGKLDLKAPISTYIDGLPEGYYPTLEKLATHTSGYTTQPYKPFDTVKFLLRMNQPDGLLHKNPFRGFPDEEGMMKILRETKLKDKEYPFVYSNIGMGILGYIVGKVTGEGFWNSLNKYIQGELHLADTYLGSVPMTGYDRKDQPCQCWQWEKDDVIAPAGALNSSVNDLLEFARIHLDGRFDYLKMCHEIHGPCEKNANSGLAWRLEKDQPISWHAGNAGAFSAFLGLNREKKTAVAVAVNYGLVGVEPIGFSILKNDLK